jgi:hypothetical protein
MAGWAFLQWVPDDVLLWLRPLLAQLNFLITDKKLAYAATRLRVVVPKVVRSSAEF